MTGATWVDMIATALAASHFDLKIKLWRTKHQYKFDLNQAPKEYWMIKLILKGVNIEVTQVSIP